MFKKIINFLIFLQLGNTLKLTKMSAPLVADMRGDIDLDCRFDMEAEQLYAVKWYKDDQEFFRFTPRQTPTTITFPVAGVHLVPFWTNCTTNHCRLRLRRLSREHSGGAYRCEISSEAPTFRLASETHNITIAALPREAPRIEGLNGPYTEGDLIATNCISDLADPAPILSWYINNHEAHPKYVGEMTSSEPNNEGLMARSLTLRFPVDRKHSQADSIELRCVATLPGIPQPPQSTSKLVGTRTIQPQVINNQKLHWQASSSSCSINISRFLILLLFISCCLHLVTLEAQILIKSKLI